MKNEWNFSEGDDDWEEPSEEEPENDNDEYDEE